jgi:hypothetical protein
MADWVTARAADGPKLAAWIRKTFPKLIYDDNAQRRVRDWEDGSIASFEGADAIITRLGGHLFEVPDECWLDENAKMRSVSAPSSKRPKREPPTPKPCKVCGEIIPLTKPSGQSRGRAAYERASFCSRECRTAGMQGHARKHMQKLDLSGDRP